MHSSNPSRNTNDFNWMLQLAWLIWKKTENVCKSNSSILPFCHSYKLGRRVFLYFVETFDSCFETIFYSKQGQILKLLTLPCLATCLCHFWRVKTTTSTRFLVHLICICLGLHVWLGRSCKTWFDNIRERTGWSCPLTNLIVKPVLLLSATLFPSALPSMIPRVLT